MHLELEVLPITGELVNKIPADIERLCNISELQTAMADEIFHLKEKDSLYGKTDYIEMIKYDVKKSDRKKYIKQLKKLPYVYAVVTNYICKGIQCFVKCPIPLGVDVAEVWHDINDEIGMDFDTKYPSDTLYKFDYEAKIWTAHAEEVKAFPIKRND